MRFWPTKIVYIYSKQWAMPKIFQQNPKSPVFHRYRKLNSSLVIIRNRTTNINLSKGFTNATDTKRVLSADDNIALSIGLVENANSAAVINQSLSLRLNTLTLHTNCCSNELDPQFMNQVLLSLMRSMTKNSICCTVSYLIHSRLLKRDQFPTYTRHISLILLKYCLVKTG